MFIRSFILLVVAAQPLLGYAETREITNFRTSDVQLETSCIKTKTVDTCVVYRLMKNERKKLISFPFPPSNIAYEDGVFAIAFPCGTECSATYFYKPTNKLGGPFPLVVSYDAGRGIVLGVSGNSLEMYDMFSSGKMKAIESITLDVGNSSIVEAIRDVELKNHTFVIAYTDRRGDIVKINKIVPVHRPDKL
ncbi:hypothetical protein [Trinickia diaoshuihuensis]|uniref:hypothetical protein n=1 Tax=Trinickia diaoshuihuensis TaxID=2292265 RepID=UPI000E266CA7|nr:hypothetical protein [Trinickia diaoshuihuensis]